MKIKGKGLKYVKLFHLLFAIAWIGGAMSMMLLLFTPSGNTPQAMQMKANVFKLIDTWLIIVGAYGILLTGLVYSIMTNWGFLKHGWITAKWILTIIMIALGIYMGQFVDGNVSTDLSFYTLHSSTYYANIDTLKTLAIIQILMLLSVIILSIWKPKRK